MSFISDYIRVYHNAIPLALCRDLIVRFDEHPAVIEGAVNTENGEHHEEIRRCLELNISRQDDLKKHHDALTQIGQVALTKYRQDVHHAIFPERYGLEAFRMKKYAPERGDHFALHVDVADYASARRFLAFFWYLNDVEQGGETYFPTMNINVHPRAGSLLMFPPLWMYPHVGQKPVSGNKYIVGSYAHYL